MARATSGSGSGYAWALVIFGAGFVICLLLMIVFYAQLGGAQAEAADARDKLGRLATSAEQGSPVVQGLLGDRSKGTVVGQLLGETTSLKNMISGDPQVSAEGLKSTVEEAGVPGTLLDEVKRLRAEFQAAIDRAENAEQKRDEADTRAHAAERQKTEVKQAFDMAQLALTQQVESVVGDAQTYLDKINAMDGRFQADFAQLRTEMQNVIDERDQIIVGKGREIADLKRKIDEVIGTSGFEVAPITAADGRIVSSISEDNKVYIDRGRNDRVMLGMTFEVFNSDHVVKLDEYDQLRGKATIEVINLDDTHAIARVVHIDRRANIKNGDIIVNLVYDVNAQLKFIVFGDFDIETDGDSSRADRKRIEAMVARWGGTLVEGMSPDVDFVVLGAEPPQPKDPAPGETNPQKIQEFVQMAKQFETWLQLKGEADKLGIPVLNQNRFLALVGYYER